MHQIPKRGYGMDMSNTSTLTPPVQASYYTNLGIGVKTTCLIWVMVQPWGDHRDSRHHTVSFVRDTNHNC